MKDEKFKAVNELTRFTTADDTIDSFGWLDVDDKGRR